MAPAKKTGSSSRSRKAQAVCRTCRKRLPLSQFSRTGGKTKARQKDCKACMREKIRRGRERAKKQRKPAEVSSEALVAQIADDTRETAKAFLTPGNVDDERYAVLAEIVFRLAEQGGQSFEGIAGELEVSTYVVGALWARGRDLCMDPTWSSQIRELLTRDLLNHAQSLSAEGAGRKDLELARSFYKDVAQLNGLLSTGNNVPQTPPVNVGVQVTVAQVREVEDQAVQYLEARQKELEAVGAEEGSG